ncbi:Arylsulfatase [Planctomycetes bacterium CA13]|uniref:Arylsulfatase n=1 Tax=Novipirellula herctigrandis TaxID=2527986 RepID=A0A5C5ZB90_9BACT|nr:Arylsulfatase [Planctomycetes bacterium CA13]
MQLRIFCACIFTFCIFANSLRSEDVTRPNIVYIMADDLGWADVGYNGAEFYETPNIDALCASGMRFTSAYPGASNCMPSRSCIMSGMYTPRTQMWTPGRMAKGNKAKMKFLVPRNSDRQGDKVFPSLGALDPSVVSVAEVLKEAGYKSAHFGKWHLGPNGQGFDINNTNGLGAGTDKRFYGNVDVAENLTTAACEFIDDHRDSPFFVYLCHWDVHTPIRARKEIVSKYSDKLSNENWTRDWNPTYAAMIEAVDTSVGRVRESLEKNGLTENTLIMFTSDNGGFSGATWCEPLKGAKGAFYEGGIRVPACVSWPKVVKPGTVCDVPITGVDIMPTFAELAGAKLPTTQPVDGKSWAPLLSGNDVLSKRAIFWHYPLYLAGAKYNKVVPIYGTDEMYWRATPCSVIREGDWKLIQFFESDSVQLYNLNDDIGEKNDLAQSNPEKATALLNQLKSWQSKTKATIPTTLNPDFGSVNGDRKSQRKPKSAAK